MTDTNKLREKINTSGLKLKFIADRLKLTRYGLQKKIENLSEFKPSEIVELCEILSIRSLKEKEEIFFVKQVD